MHNLFHYNFQWASGSILSIEPAAFPEKLGSIRLASIALFRAGTSISHDSFWLAKPPATNALSIITTQKMRGAVLLSALAFATIIYTKSLRCTSVCGPRRTAPRRPMCPGPHATTEKRGGLWWTMLGAVCVTKYKASWLVNIYAYCK